MTSGRRVFLATLGIGLGGVVAGCGPTPGRGVHRTTTSSIPGPQDAEDVMEQATLAPPPDGATMEMMDREPPQGYAWAREVTFVIPAAEVDPWAVASFGSADALSRAFVVSQQFKEAFDVEDVPDTWRMRTASVEGTYLGLFVLVDDADPATVRIHLNRRLD